MVKSSGDARGKDKFLMVWFWNLGTLENIKGTHKHL